MSWATVLASNPDFEEELLQDLEKRTGIAAGRRVRFVNAAPHAGKEGTVEKWTETEHGLRPLVVTEAGERIKVERVSLLEVVAEERAGE